MVFACVLSRCRTSSWCSRVFYLAVGRHHGVRVQSHDCCSDREVWHPPTSRHLHPHAGRRTTEMVESACLC